MLAAFAAVGRRIVYAEWLGAGPNDVYLPQLGWSDVIFALVILAALVTALLFGPRLCGLLADLLEHLHLIGRPTGRFTTARRWFAVWSIGIVLCWLPYLLLYWPGVLVGDSLASVGPMVGDRPLENHHPVAFTLFVGLFLRIGEVLGVSITTSMAMFSATQMIVMAAAIAYAATWLVRHAGASKLLATIVVVSFALLPVFPIYAMNMQKDPLFATAMLLFALKVTEVMIRGGAPLRDPRGIAVLTALSIWLSLWRNGGSLLVAATMVVLLAIWRRSAAPAFVSVALALALCSVSLSIAESTAVEPPPAAEKLAIPLQQVAASLLDGAKVPPEDAEVLESILPSELWVERYTPARVDAIKWSSEFDDAYLDNHVGDFLQVWASMAPQNLDSYARGWVLETFGFWTPGAKNDYGFIDSHLSENPFGIERTPRVDSILWWDAKTISEEADYFGSGTLAWFVLISGYLVLVSRRPSLAVAYVPLVLIWVAGLVATPVAFSLRYVFSWALALPFLLLAPVLANRRGDIASGDGAQREESAPHCSIS